MPATRTVAFPPGVLANISVDSTYPGRQVHASPYTGQERIARLGTHLWTGTFTIPAMSSWDDLPDGATESIPNVETARRLNALFSLAYQNPDVRFALPIDQDQDSSSFVKSGATVGTGNAAGKIWASGLVQDDDEGPMLLFAQRSHGAQVGATLGNVKVNPRVGDFFYGAGRLLRVAAVKHSAEVALTSPAYPQISIQPAIYPYIVTGAALTDTPAPTEFLPARRIWARLVGNAPPSNWGRDFAGPWTGRWIQWMPPSAGALETAPLQQQWEYEGVIELTLGVPRKALTSTLWFDPIGDPVTQDAQSEGGKFTSEPSGKDFILVGTELGGDSVRFLGFPSRGRTPGEHIVPVVVVPQAGASAPTKEESVPLVALTIVQRRNGTEYVPKTLDFVDNFSKNAERVVIEPVDPTIARGVPIGGMKGDFIPVRPGRTVNRVYGVDSTGARSPAWNVGIEVKRVREGEFDPGTNELFCGPPKSDFEAISLKATAIGDIAQQVQFRIRDYVGPDDAVFSSVTFDDIKRAGYGTNGAEDKGAVVTTQIDGELITVIAKNVNDLRRINRTLNNKKTSANWNDSISSTVRLTVKDQNEREVNCDLPVTLFYSGTGQPPVGPRTANKPPVLTDNSRIDLDTLVRQEYNLDATAYDPEGTDLTWRIRNPQPVGVTADFYETRVGAPDRDTARPHTLRLTRTRALNQPFTSTALLLTATDEDGGTLNFQRNIFLDNPDAPTGDLSAQLGPLSIPTIYVGDSTPITLDLTATGTDKDGLTISAVIRGGGGVLGADASSMKAEVTRAASPYLLTISPSQPGGVFSAPGRYSLSLGGTKAMHRGSASRAYSFEVRRRPQVRPAWNLPTIINLTVGDTPLAFDQDDYVVKNGNTVTYTRSASSAPTKFTALPASGRPLSLAAVAANNFADSLILEMTGDDGVKIEGRCPVKVSAAQVDPPPDQKPVCTAGVAFGSDAADPIYQDGSNRYRADFAKVFRAGSGSAIKWGTLTLRPKASTTRSPNKINWERPSPIGTFLYFRGRSGQTAGTQTFQARVQSFTGVWSDWCDFTARTRVAPVARRPRLTFHPSTQYQVNKPNDFVRDYYGDTEWDGDASDLAYSASTGRHNLEVSFERGDPIPGQTPADSKVRIKSATATQPVYPISVRVWVKSNPSLFDRNSHQLTVLPAGGGGGDEPPPDGPDDGD